MSRKCFKGWRYDVRSAAVILWSHHWQHPATQEESETIGTFYFHWAPTPELYEIETAEGFDLEDLMQELGRRGAAMRPHRTCFEKFAESLTLEERAAVRQWLNVGYDIIRGFQSEGGVPEHLSFQQVEALERHFSSALSKAVVCREMVFRGLSTGNWRPERVEFLRGLIHGPEEITLTSHDSATLSEKIGRDWCLISPDEEERHLSVFLRVQPQRARYLAPFTHQAGDEEEVVLLKGTRYRRTSSRRLPDPRPGQEYWEVDLVEESEGQLHSLVCPLIVYTDLDTSFCKILE